MKGYWFHFPIPTPVFAAGRQSTLHRVFVLWKGSSPSVSPVVLHVFDGPTRVDALAFADGPGRTGEGGRDDLIAVVHNHRVTAGDEFYARQFLQESLVPEDEDVPVRRRRTLSVHLRAD